MAQSVPFVSFYLVVKFDAELPTMCQERISSLQSETVRGVARIFSEVPTILQIALIIIRNNVDHAFEWFFYTQEYGLCIPQNLI